VKAPPRAYAVPRLSPDGTRVALDIRDQENDIWILDLTRDAALRRLTYGPSADTNPLWASSTHLIFTSNRSGRLELHRQAADGSGMPEQVTSGGNSKYATSLAPDGASVVGHQDGPNTFDVARFPLTRSGSDGGPPPEPLVSTGYTEHNAELSPNGRYLAYQSNESGPFQVIVRPYPVLNGKWTVSPGVGTRPVWARSGRELFYRDEQDGVVAVPVDTSGATFTWGTAHKLFDHVDTALVPDRDYDVSPDGERFLMLTDDTLGRKSEIVVVLDWIEELKAKIPVP
jgi:eukaryotic-like serine/threonine-protein kinase